MTNSAQPLPSKGAALAELDRLRHAVNSAHCHSYGERMEGKFIRSAYHMIPKNNGSPLPPSARQSREQGGSQTKEGK